MLDLGDAPEIVERIVAHIVEYYLEYNRRVFEAAAGGIDIFMMGDDFACRPRRCSVPGMWERFFGDGFRRFIALAHRYNIKVMHHTCGAVRPLIPAFIDAGLDILQSLQPRAAGMDLRELKRDFGADLCFHGGIDIQHTLPTARRAEIDAEVRERLQAGKPGGGYIICTAHNIQADTPVENVLALAKGYRRYGGY